MNTNLIKAKKEKNDEFYTYLEDIDNELKNYTEHFKNKTVYCNCDNPEWSNFYIYFKNNFYKLGLKKLICTFYNINNNNNNNNNSYKLEFLINKDNILIENKKYLKGDGDFRSQECIELLKESDIVCTNPPFSLFREYVSQLIEYDKKFLIIGSVNAITYKEIFPLIKENKLWLGVSPRSMEFYKDINKTEKKSVNACWFTNLSHKKRNEEIILWKEYNNEEYPKYDNYNAIEISKVSQIPKDYNGYMAVPITFLEKFNPKQFEICNANDIKQNENIKKKPHGLIKDKEGTVNGKIKYVRFVIKRINYN